jgi:hypothetical protein
MIINLEKHPNKELITSSLKPATQPSLRSLLPAGALDADVFKTPHDFFTADLSANYFTDTITAGSVLLLNGFKYGVLSNKVKPGPQGKQFSLVLFKLNDESFGSQRQFKLHSN